MFVLRPHQVAGAAWLARRTFALLLDEPRVGKTHTALAAIQQADARRNLVVCPAIARGVWRKAADDLWLSDRVQVCSYDELVRNSATRARVVESSWDVVVVDEAHYLKSPTARRTRVVYGSAARPGLCHRAEKVWGLTGTLLPNHLGEAWTHFRMGQVTTLSYSSFLHRYCVGYATPWGWQVSGVRDEHVAEFVQQLRSISLRRRLRDLWPEMPPLSWRVEELVCEPETLHAISAEVQLERVLRRVKEGWSWDAALADPGFVEACRVVTRAKLPLVEAFLRLLLDGGVSKLVVFVWFHESGERLVRALASYRPRIVFGDTPDRCRLDALRVFADDPLCRVLIGNYRAMGTAVSLSAARCAVFVDLPAGFGDLLQAAQRIVSPTQTEPAEVILCAVQGTVDAAILNLLAKKAEQVGVLDTVAVS